MVRGLEAGKRPALLISECQRGILDPELTMLGGLAEQVSIRGVLPRIAELATVFRNVGAPVFHIHIGHRPDFAGAAITSPLMSKSRREGKMTIGSADVEAMPEVEPVEGDFVCSRKSGLAMWHGTELDLLLRNLGVQTVVLVGVSTNLALFGGSLGAVDRGYQSVIPEDATAGGTADTHEWMVKNSLPLLSSMTTTAEVIETMQSWS